MFHGFVSAAAATPDLRVADCEHNVRQILSMRQTAIDNNASILLLPALCLTGATCGDLFFQYSLLDAAVEGLLTVCEAGASDDLLTFVGLPLPLDGKLYHCVAALHRGVILGIVPERAPSDTRRFAPAGTTRTTLTIEGRQVPFGVDLLFTCANVPSLSVGVAFSCHETRRLASGGATLIVYPEARPSFVSHYVKSRSMWLSQSAMNHTAALHAGAGLGESVSEGVFAGHGLVIENGRLLAEAPRFSTAMAISEVDLERIENDRRRSPYFTADPAGPARISFFFDKRETPLTRSVPHLPFVPEYAPEWGSHCEEAFLMAAHALAGRIRRYGAGGVVLRLSGNLDSTLAALTTVNAMSLLERPASDVTALIMPGYSTGVRASTNARHLGELLGFTVRETDIRPLVVQYLDAMGREDRDGSAFENVQERERSRILLDVADQTGGMVVDYVDMTDLALGNHTFGGHISRFDINGGIPKTLALAMLQYAAEQATDGLRDVLLDVAETPAPSGRIPGDGHDGRDAVGPFELHDFFLYYTVRWGFPPEKILRLARRAFGEKYGDGDLEHILRIFYKRFFNTRHAHACSPDVAHMGSVSVTPGHFASPSEAEAAVWLDSFPPDANS